MKLSSLMIFLIFLSSLAINPALCRQSPPSEDRLLITVTFTADIWGAEEEVYRILEALDEYRVRSTFFFLGKYAELKPRVLKSVLGEGHEIGARTYDHSRRLIDMTAQEQLLDINRTVNAIERAAGVKPIGFAAPGYFLNQETLATLRKLGFLYDRSARGALRAPNNETAWRWQDETVRGVRYEGIFSNQRPFEFKGGPFEFPVTYALNYGNFNKTSGLDPLWWEKVNGTDVILSDGTWIAELKWDQTQSLNLLKYGITQQLAFKTPLVVSFSTHIIGRSDWIWVLKSFLEEAKSRGATFLTLTELMDWWFLGKAVRMWKTVHPTAIPAGKEIKVEITVEALKGTFDSISLFETVADLGEIKSPDGSVSKGKRGATITWVRNNFSGKETFTYSIDTKLSSVLTFESAYDRSMRTVSRGFSTRATLKAHGLSHGVGPILADGKVYLQPSSFWLLVASALALISLLALILWRKAKIGFVGVGIALATYGIAVSAPRKFEVITAILLSASIATAFYIAAVTLLKRKRKWFF